MKIADTNTKSIDKIDRIQDDEDCYSFDEDASLKDEDEYNLEDQTDENKIFMMIKKLRQISIQNLKTKLNPMCPIKIDQIFKKCKDLENDFYIFDGFI